jgi:hypothetical protein
MTDTESFGYLVHHGLAEELYRSGEQRFWIIDSGSSHRGEAAKELLHQVNSRIMLVHTPVHRLFTWKPSQETDLLDDSPSQPSASFRLQDRSAKSISSSL